jgi:hypothetical protein
MKQSGNSQINLSHVVRQARPSRGFMLGSLIVGALVAFEVFNYSTTDFALNDLLGGLSFMGLRWATILAIAFCGIDFAGLARLFTPERGGGEHKEVWYLFGAWLLAAAMNAMLTYWGVSIAILSHESLGGTVIPSETMLKVVPVFVAVMVWVIRVLIIGSFSVTGERLFSQERTLQRTQPASPQHQPQPMAASAALSMPNASLKSAYRPDPKPAAAGMVRSEPTYHPVSMSASGQAPVHRSK